MGDRPLHAKAATHDRHRDLVQEKDNHPGCSQQEDYHSRIGSPMSRLGHARTKWRLPTALLPKGLDQTRKRNREAVRDGRWNAVPISNYRRLDE